MLRWRNLHFDQIEAHLKHLQGEFRFSDILKSSREPDHQKNTSISLLVGAIKACRSLGDLEPARKIHADAIATGDDSLGSVTATLINMYARCGSLVDAKRVFESSSKRDAASWTAIMLGYAENGDGETALELFERMQTEVCEVDDRALLAAIKSCCTLASKETGVEVTGKLVKFHSLIRGMAVHSRAGDWAYESIFITNVLVDMYAKCGSMKDSRMVFDRMAVRDVVSWTSLMLGYVDGGEPEVALDLFFCMRPEGCVADARTFVAALKTCSALATREEGQEVDGKVVKSKVLERGRRVHSLAREHGHDSDLFVASILVDMYSKCGSMEDARRVFESIDFPDVVTWTALMLGYAESGEGELALSLFSHMEQRGGAFVDPPVFAAIFKACSNIANFRFGKCFHGEICKLGLETHALVSNCLVDFYGKCGSMEEAEQVFNSLSSSDLVTWSALITGYSRQGDSTRVFSLARKMSEEGIRADGVTFISILTACSHAGLTEKGKAYFNLMKKLGLRPNVEHYICMVDILGRGSELEGAVRMVRTMPFEASALAWRTVLGACRKWKNVELGRVAFEELVKLDPRNASPYTLMASLYGALGLWEEQSKVEAMRVQAEAWRVPGKSWWTDREGRVHSFVVGDVKHPQREEIQAKLKQLVVRMKEELGYVADVGSVVHNIPDSDKEDSLCGHSERLAIACALINSDKGETVRIMKNLRVCDDCHGAIAVVSKIEQRKIICRDASRFHVYEDGKCSCGDYW